MTNQCENRILEARACPHLDGAPGRVGEKIDGAVVAVINVEAQQEIQLPHIYLFTH